MLFTSLKYVVFLTIVFIVYWGISFNPSLLGKDCKARWQNIILLLASYMFYAIGDWRFLGLLIGMSFFSYFVGRCAANKPDTPPRGYSHRKAAVATSVIVDILILGVFKYYNFFASSFANLLGMSPDSVTLNLVLPLGISFFTFQAISYVVDAYRGKIIINQQSSIDSLIECLLYIGFFPKLLAGPIERPTNLIPQIQSERKFDYALAVDGCRQILWGLFKKVVIADNCASFVDNAWGDIASQSGSTLLLMAILYTIQIYGDFSGYSDMAIGSAKLLGFRFRDNFLFPYFSRNMGEFWKRWHISLNTWFVDYVYIPLGGSREGKLKTITNTFTIFLLSGLWHGADWSFVAWGGYHGLLVVLLILMGWNTRYDRVVAANRWLPSIKEFLQMMLVFALATFGWILFRAETMGQFLEFMQQMCTHSLFSKPDIGGMNGLLLMIVIMFSVEWLMRDKKHGLDLCGIKNSVLRWTIYLGMMFMIFAFGGHTVNFIYAQF